jgi:hypothetical protein
LETPSASWLPLNPAHLWGVVMFGPGLAWL